MGTEPVDAEKVSRGHPVPVRVRAASRALPHRLARLAEERTAQIQRHREPCGDQQTLPRGSSVRDEFVFAAPVGHPRRPGGESVRPGGLFGAFRGQERPDEDGSDEPLLVEGGSRRAMKWYFVFEY